MPARALHHHVVGAGVAEGAPLDEVLGEGGKGLLAALTRSEIACAQLPQRVLFREIVDGARGGCRLDRAFDRWIGEVAAGERWCEPAKFSAGVDPAEP